MMDLVRALRLVYIADLTAAADVGRLGHLFRGGVTAVWLRAPTATGALLYEHALALRELTRAADVALLVGDRVDVARAVRAEGVQLGHRAPPLEALRDDYAGWMGCSCHGAEELARARAGGADHAVLSPVFAVPGKGDPLGVAGFEAVRADVSLPVVALGGIGADAVPLLCAAGADGVAAIRALRDAADPFLAAQRLSARIPGSGVTSP